MSEFIRIENATLVTGVTSMGTFLPIEINNRNIGTPMYQFSQTYPDIDLFPPTPGLDLPPVTFYNTATSYGIGVALSINGSALAIPIHKLPQDVEVVPNLDFTNPTYVTDLSSTGQFMVLAVDNSYFGMMLYEFGTQYPSLCALSALVSNVTTVIRAGKPTLDLIRDVGSSYLNPKIKAYSDVLTRIKRMLGWPSIDFNICDENISEYIDQAIEFYTKYAGFTEEFLIFNTEKAYTRGCGMRLDRIFSSTPEMNTTCFNGASGSYDYDLMSYRKVSDVYSFEQGESTGINTLFTLEQAMAQQTYFSYMLGNAGFDLVTFDVMKSWLETRSKVLAQTPYFRFDAKTQIFKILPEPMLNQNYYGVIGCYVEQPIKYIINERWVMYYALALTKIAIGHIRGKYAGMVLFGGGTLNANDVLSQGLNEKKELEEELLKSYGEVMPAKFFMG